MFFVGWGFANAAVFTAWTFRLWRLTMQTKGSSDGHRRMLVAFAACANRRPVELSPALCPAYVLAHEELVDG